MLTNNQISYLPYDDYAQSANTLFHFMKKQEYLNSILRRRAIIPRYCVETIDYLSIKNGTRLFNEVAILQKCFCDIPFHKLAEYPEVLHIIGVAHESSEGQYTSEDFIYLDAREWSKEQQAEALKLKQEYEMHGCLAKRTMISRTFYPDNFKMKGRDRNKPSPCGSGKKFKNCCGK